MLLQFRKNEELQQELLSTNDNKFVYACTDRLLGTGCGVNDDNIRKPNAWRGKNYLGKALVEIRELYQKSANISQEIKVYFFVCLTFVFL